MTKAAAKKSTTSDRVRALAQKHNAAPVSEDKLEKVRDRVREARDLDVKIAQYAQEAAGAGERKNAILFNELPEMFDEVKITSLGLDAEGDLPAYHTELKDFYKASIPKDKEEPAFKWLEKNKHGDMIKTVITIELGRGDRATAKLVEDFLKKQKVGYTRKLAVPWNTLTAFVKEQTEKQIALPLDLLGATIGRVVKLIPVKEKK